MPAPTLTTEQRLAQQKLVDAEAKQRITAAMDAVERAQCELDRAAQQLSAITFIAPEWKAVLAERERVHKLWYRVRRTAGRERATLDGDAAARFLARLSASSTCERCGDLGRFADAPCSCPAGAAGREAQP